MNASLQTPPKLPDSIEQCHALIEAQAGTISQLSARVEQLLRRLFGTRSERLDPNQLALFAEAWAQEQAAQLISGFSKPVYLLGGVGPAEREKAWQNGAQGVAGIRAFWPEV